jgi:predicted ATPase/serine phosphatase RsbU (regulator of sigma subunit)
MKQWGDYDVGEELYVGDETRVVRAKSSDGTPVMLKRPRGEPADPRAVGRLHHEYAVLRELVRVEGVVRARGLETLRGSVTLVLDDVGLPSLEQVLAKRGRLGLVDALELAIASCRILERVHVAGILHKDVTPRNLLVDEASFKNVFLVNFGIASRLAFEATSALIPEALEGTLAYISPEQTGRTARLLDSRTDLYSLGVTLYEALAGRRPFLESDPLAIVHSHLARYAPPLESLAPEVPSTVARIVERLLAKTPDHRYQTARGVAHDVTECLRRLAATGRIEPFAVGQRDYSPQLRLPETLIGREEEVKAVRASFERAAKGDVEVLMVGGPSGIGKTALVRSVYSEIAKAGRGLLLSGKHDQLARSTPFAAIAQAVGGLMQQIAATPRAVLEVWQDRFRDAVGDNLRVIADLVPELEWVMGKLAPVQPVPTEMAYHRLKLSWIYFIQALVKAQAPLVFFLDDMQWVDHASVELIKLLLTDPERQSILLIAAYRDNEVEPGHPLLKLVADIETTGATTSRLTVEALDVAKVEHFLAATFATEPARAGELAQVLWRKTRGNPFFMGQLLLELYRSKLIRRDLDNGIWHWSISGIESASITENVVELMRQGLRELPEATQNILGLAACAGHTFTLGELAILSGEDISHVSRALWPALHDGMIVPVDALYREARALAEAEPAHGSAPASRRVDARYHFSHDRVQQACYERIAEGERARAHQEIGQRLRARYEHDGGTAQELVEVLRHLDLGATTLQSDEARSDLARLNLQAAKAAKANAAYKVQAALLDMALSLIGERAAGDEAALFVEASIERMEADFMLRAFEEVHARGEALLGIGLPEVARLAVSELRVRTSLATGQFAEGERLGLAALGERGIAYPETNAGCIEYALRGFDSLDAWLDTHEDGFESFSLEASVEHTLVTALDAMMMLCAGLGTRPALAAAVVVRATQVAIARRSLTIVCPLMLGALAHSRSSFSGSYRKNGRWAREGLQAARRVGSPFMPDCEVLAGLYEMFQTPAARTRVFFQRALRSSSASGSFQGTSWALLTELSYCDMWAGQRLSRIAEAERAQRSLMARAGDVVGQNNFRLNADVCRFLLAPFGSGPDGEHEDLAATARHFEAVGDGPAVALLRLHEILIEICLGHRARAFALAEQAEAQRPILYGLPVVTDIPLYRGLAASKCHTPDKPDTERVRLMGLVAQGIERFVYFTEGCQENFGHKLALLRAEHARLEGRFEAAMMHYDEAIDDARAQGFRHIEGLSAQFAFEFHLAAGRRKLARYYLLEAIDAYRRWDALRIVTYLQHEYADLLAQPKAHEVHARPNEEPTVLASSGAPHAAVAGGTAGSALLDVGTVVRSAQAVSSELDPEKVVSRLMHLVLENAGAQRGVLFLGEYGSLALTARLDAAAKRVETGLDVAFVDCNDIAKSAVELVARAMAPMVIADVTDDVRVVADPHFAGAATKALLVTPFVHQGRLVGVLYLEHGDVGAFVPERVALVGVLATQSAIALENARLYVELQAASDELKQANEGLEAQVASRTVELQKALGVLWGEIDLAKKIQTVLLPSDGAFAGCEFAATMNPAEDVGGDYYDVFEAGDQTWVLIGDVSGHGVSAGLIMMMIQTAMRSVIEGMRVRQGDLSPSAVLARVNRAVHANLKRIGQRQYMTVTALCFEGDVVRYSGLHQDLLVYRADTGRVDRIETGGMWLGVVDDIGGVLDDRELELAPGDTLLLYTDGITEARRPSGEMIGVEPLAAWLGEAAPMADGARAVVDGVLARVGPMRTDDDVTVMAIQRVRS